VGLKTLKNKLSEYVRMAAAGEIVLISNRDRIVAELVPPAATRADRVHDAVLADKRVRVTHSRARILSPVLAR
jgi:prevent-host-death family protein